MAEKAQRLCRRNFNAFSNVNFVRIKIKKIIGFRIKHEIQFCWNLRQSNGFLNGVWTVFFLKSRPLNQQGTNINEISCNEVSQIRCIFNKLISHSITKKNIVEKSSSISLVFIMVMKNQKENTKYDLLKMFNDLELAQRKKNSHVDAKRAEWTSTWCVYYGKPFFKNPRDDVRLRTIDSCGWHWLWVST